MNINVPVNAVKAKAAHVHFRMSDAIRLNDRWVEAIPNNRRSMIAIVPKTRARPMTCVDSIRGNSQSEFRILLAIPDASSDLRKATISIGPISNLKSPNTMRLHYAFVAGDQ